MKIPYNVKNGYQVCAFCKYWYDPGNTAIKPKDPQHGMWEYDSEAKSYCTIHQGQTIALAKSRCSHFECKIPK